jgi:ABC-type polysaccharide/polyol phosphate transport system ATPase subunit
VGTGLVRARPTRPLRVDVRVRGQNRDRRQEVVLDGDGVVADHLSKIYHDLAERVFDAPTPVLTRAFRGRRPAGFDEEEGGDEDDDEDDEGADEEERVERDISEEREPAVWGLRDISFRIPRGASVALVGDSGSGKTTLLRVLGGAIPPTSGRAVLAGRPSPLINVALQLMVSTLSPEANVAVAGALVGLTKRRLRPQLDDIFELAEVSARERRVGITQSPFKVAVASALRLESEVLLLDDPFSAASSSFRERIIDAIENRRADGATVLIETRDREVLRRLCDQALWLDSGGLVRVGDVDDILAAHDSAAVAAGSSAPSRTRAIGFNDTAAVVSATAEAEPDGRVSIDVCLELARAAVSIQAGIGLERPDGVGLWFEQSSPVVCRLRGFHHFRLVARDVPPGRYDGRVQARVLEAGAEAVIARRHAFELAVGDPADGAPITAGETTWKRHDGSWLYESSPPTG